MNITIIGSGYVGFSLGVLLAQKNKVFCTTSNKQKKKNIKKNIFPISDKFIYKIFPLIKNNLKITLNKIKAIKKSKIIIIAVPTNYNNITKKLNTTIIEQNINLCSKLNSEAIIIIKSTVPIGFTKNIQKKYKNKILFCPEFLKEKTSLKDIFYPDRIIIGINNSKSKKIAKKFLKILKECCFKKNIKYQIIDSKEAESIKLFSNAYLGLRIDFFNELDIFANSLNLNSKNIIKGVCLDKRIGLYYNQPSSGYGGKCLPKDIKQLIYEYQINNIPNFIIKNIDNSNELIKRFKQNV